MILGIAVEIVHLLHYVVLQKHLLSPRSPVNAVQNMDASLQIQTDVLPHFHNREILVMPM